MSNVLMVLSSLSYGMEFGVGYVGLSSWLCLSEQSAMLMAHGKLMSAPVPWIWDWGLGLDN